MLKKWLFLSAMAVTFITACHSPVYNQTEANVADAKIKVTEGLRKSDNSAKPPSPLLVKQGLYVDNSPINLVKTPSWLETHIVIRGDQLPFSYYSHVITGNSASLTTVLTKYQAGLDDTVLLGMNYTGSVKGALDLLAARTGYAYHVQNNTIYWEAFVTRTFDVAFLPGGTDYL